jgi:hypothetical protein
MTTRRQFIIGATAGAAALTLPSRAFAGPPVEGTFGFVTDIHHGGGAAFRLGIWERDALSLRFPYFTGGDIVERADSTSNWSSAKAWRDRVRTSTGIRDTLLGPEGNHDEKDGSALYAANWCEPDGSRTMSGPVLYRVVWVSPSSVPLADGHSRCLYDGKLAWLDRTLAQSSLRTFVILHAPLEKTIPKDPQGTWTENPVMVATPTEGLDAIFARHRHVAAILSGHVHPGRNQRWYGWREVAPGNWMPWVVGPAVLNQPDPAVSDSRNSTRVDGLYIGVRPWGFNLWRRRHYDHAWDLLQAITWRTT